MKEDDADVFDIKIFAFERPTKISIEGRVDFADGLFEDEGRDVRIELFVSDQANMQLIKS